jgi:hypothetical protein
MKYLGMNGAGPLIGARSAEGVDMDEHQPNVPCPEFVAARGSGDGDRY